MILHTARHPVGGTVEVFPDPYPDDPRDDAPLTALVLRTRSWTVDELDVRPAFYDTLDDLRRAVEATPGVRYVHTVYLADHGDIALGLAASCPWDSGPVGFAVVTAEALTVWGYDPTCPPAEADAVRAVVAAELDAYAAYLNGHVYAARCTVTLPNGEVVEESCHGFIDSDDAAAWAMDELNEVWRDVLRSLPRLVAG